MASAPTGPRPINPAWTAGFLDGEGCFLINRGIRVSVTNTHLPTLEYLRDAYGGSVRAMSARRASHRPLFQWYVGGGNAEALCRAVVPFLREKRQQCELLLRYRSLPRGSSLFKTSMAEELRRMKRPTFSLETHAETQVQEQA